MNILKAIGARLTKLWRWIRETAWVQPLLIVGSIFAVIFSIPKFTTWFSAMGGAGSSSTYFSSYKITLEGEGALEGGVTIDTEADRLTRSLFDTSFVSKTDYPTYEEYRAALTDRSEGSIGETNPLGFGEKYFLVYLDSSTADTLTEGFKTLQENWNTRFETIEKKNGEDELPFRLKTIFTDETSSNDDDFELEEDKVAFNRYLEKWSGALPGGADFFSQAGGRLEDTPYKLNASISASYYQHITEAANIDKPTIFLVDFTEAAYDLGRPGVSEAAFSIEGTAAYDKADFLLDMWNHTEITDTANKFTENYQK